MGFPYVPFFPSKNFMFLVQFGGDLMTLGVECYIRK